MKRFVFLVLVLAAATFAEEEGIKQWAENFESDTETVEACISDAGTTEAELQNVMQQIEKLEGDDMDEKTKKGFEKHNRFLACMLEKKDMMKDSKLVVDKIMESMEKDSDKLSLNKDSVKECLNAVNEDSSMTREDRALGLTVCIYASSEDKEK